MFRPNRYYNIFQEEVGVFSLSFMKMLLSSVTFGLLAGLFFRKLALVKVFVCIAVFIVTMELVSQEWGRIYLLLLRYPRKCNIRGG